MSFVEDLSKQYVKRLEGLKQEIDTSLQEKGSVFLVDVQQYSFPERAAIEKYLVEQGCEVKGSRDSRGDEYLEGKKSPPPSQPSA